MLSTPPFVRVFVRRRQAWLPTVWGVTALLLLAACLVVFVGRYVNRWLSVDAPARGPDGGGARTLVVEGWMSPYNLDQALQTFRRGHYERLVTTGGPNYEWVEPNGFTNYADRAADYLKRRGAPAAQVFAVPAPASAQDRTFLSAVMVREWGRHTGVRLDAIDVFSVGAHARRSHMVYRMAFAPDVDVGILAAPAASFDADRWWASSAGVKSIMGETLSIAWTVCCFWPPPPGSHEERWATPAAAKPAASGAAPA